MNIIRIADRMVSNAPEAPKGAPFGQWAWAPYRENVPEEPDNDLEKEVYQHIKRHFDTKHVGIPLVTAGLLSMLMAIGWYKPVIHPPPHETLYRGIKIIGKSVLSELLGQEIEEETGFMDLEEGRIFPTENGNSSSWSSKKKITKDFSEKGVRGWSVTLIADTAANPFRFIAGPGGLYDVEGLSSFHLEKETVGLEPILIRRVEWQRIG